MWSIKHLPQHLINKLKAGEIVERPASIVKELVENSLDAGATDLRIWIEEGGKTLIKVQDNGTGITYDDLPMAVERYATSKISRDEDLESIASYGFRGEALAAIAEVSRRMIQTKTAENPDGVGYTLMKTGGELVVKQMPFTQAHGTIIAIEDLFHDVPVRAKFLKSATTEWHYIRQLLSNYLIFHRDKDRQVWHNGKLIWKVSATTSLLERILEITTTQRQPHLHAFTEQITGGTIYGVLGDAALHFPSAEQMRFFVNERPVDDKILKKAIMQLMKRQLPAGLFPFIYLFVQLDPTQVDVNVHPRKTEVKFLDPWAMFSSVTHALSNHIWEQKVSYAAFTQAPVKPTTTYTVHRSSWQKTASFWQATYHQKADTSLFDQIQLQDAQDIMLGGERVEIIGQLWQMYILASSATGIYLIDQHALAERMAFEHMKRQAAAQWFVPQVLLQPIIVPLPSADIALQERQTIFAKIGIDASLFGENKMIIHTMPQVFIDRVVDMQVICRQIRGQQEQWHTEGGERTPEQIFSTILEEMHGMKACKASITAGQQLSLHEMRELVREGQWVIPHMFVCQHGRPSVVKIDKTQLDHMVWR